MSTDLVSRLATEIAARLTSEIAARPHFTADDAIKHLLGQYSTPVDAGTRKRLATQTALPPRLGSADTVTYLEEEHGISITESTLKTWAWRGGGPAFQKCGPRRLYPIEELDAWAKQRLSPVVASTSELTTLIGCDPVQELVQKPAPVVGVGKAKQAPARSTPPPRLRSLAISNAPEEAREDSRASRAR